MPTMPAMWDRFRSTQKDGGAPPLNRKKLESWQTSRSSNVPKQTNTKGYSYVIKGGPPPPRPPRDFEYLTEPYQTSAPAVQAPPPAPQARNTVRNAQYGRPASSVYSQPSPVAATFAAQQLRNNLNEISPPSSPDISTPRNGPRRYDDEDVSPIDEKSNFTMDRSQKSSIPTMRRERRKNSDAAMNALRQSKSRERLTSQRPRDHNVRWDAMTGEPTTSDRGRPSQVNPQEYAQGFGKSQGTNISSGQHMEKISTPFGERIRRLPRQENTIPEPQPQQRPEWRGASGRTTLVPPVNDDRNVPPLSIPRKSSKRGTPPRGAASNNNAALVSPVSSLESETTETVSDQPSQPRVKDSSSTIRSVVPSNQFSGSAQATSYPSPPPSDDNSVPAKTEPLAPRSSSLTPQTLHPNNNNKAIRRKPAGGQGHAPNVSNSSSVYSQHDIHPARAPPGGFPDDWTQPPSRFSVTTYATSAHTSTPRQSVDDEAPPLPTPPKQYTVTPPKPVNGNSILDRKRPVVSGYENEPRNRVPSEPIKLNMDSPYYMTPAVSAKARPRPVPFSNHSTLSVVSVSSGDKNLPLAPPEESARDRVTQLNARLEALGNRRININQAIKQMTELMPTDNILASDAVVRKREAEKRKVENLKIELADVQREEYELGLKLHRAYKRMDRDAEYEPTTLWVRRVTG